MSAAEQCDDGEVRPAYLVGPWASGLIKGTTGSAVGGLLFLSALLFVAFAMMALMRLNHAVSPEAVAAAAPGQ